MQPQMTAKNNFSNVQRMNSTIMAKCEWTSSRIGMRKNTDEVRDRRTKTYRKANQFLEDLLEQNRDEKSFDDNGVIDRYKKFLKSKSNSNDDGYLLDEFNRRLRSVNNDNRRYQSSKSINELSGVNRIQTRNEFDDDMEDNIHYRRKSMVRSSLNDPNINQFSEEDDIDHVSFLDETSTSPMSRSMIEVPSKQRVRSTHENQSPLNRSMIEKSQADDLDESSASLLNHSMTESVFQSKSRHFDDPLISSSDHLTKIIQRIDSSEDIKESSTALLNRSMTRLLPTPKIRQANDNEDKVRSPTTPLNRSITKILSKPKMQRSDSHEDTQESSPTNTLYKPKARRADGTEIIVSRTVNSLQHIPSDVLLFKHCHFPRSLTSHEPVDITITTSKLSTLSPPIKQYNHHELVHLLDEIENDCSPDSFADMLDQLTLPSVQAQSTDNNNESLISDDNDEENIPILPNIFDQSSHDYYTTTTININDPRKLSLYTMTIGIVQLSPNLILPYSMLNGHRPLLQKSIQTNFKQIRSKQPKHTYQVTAVKSPIHFEHLQENDIILKINDQSVWNLTIDAVRDLLKTQNCSLTIARLCQPLF